MGLAQEYVIEHRALDCIMVRLGLGKLSIKIEKIELWRCMHCVVFEGVVGRVCCVESRVVLTPRF